MALPRYEQDKKSAQMTTGAYKEVRDRGVRKFVVSKASALHRIAKYICSAAAVNMGSGLKTKPAAHILQKRRQAQKQRKLPHF